jgi:PIN domain nuclease of toxin-antitoxin system
MPVRVLVDTHVLLWAATAPDRLPQRFREYLESPANDVFFSAASIWEIAIKSQIKRIDLTIDPAELARGAVENGFEELAVTSVHTAGVFQLPLHHRDPFDRILIAQALAEPARLLTVDATLARYSELVEVGQ